MCASSQTAPTLSHADLFADVYARCFARLCWTARKVLNNPHDAEDIVQWAFARAWERRDEFRDLRALPAWLKITVFRRAIKRARLDQREVTESPEHTAALHPSAWPDAILQRAQQRAQLHAAVHTLSPRQRQVVELRLEHGWTFREIAGHVGCTGVAARVNFTHGVRNVRSALCA